MLLGYLLSGSSATGHLSSLAWAQRSPRGLPRGISRQLSSTATTYVVPVEKLTPEGVSIDYVERTVSFTHGAVYWAILLAVVDHRHRC